MTRRSFAASAAFKSAALFCASSIENTVWDSRALRLFSLNGRPNVRKRILKYFICVIATGIALTTVMMTWLTYRLLEDRVMEELRFNAALIGALFEQNGEQTVEDVLDGRLRVTWIGADGDVRYDNAANAGMMDNHAERPEVQRALEDGEGEAIRGSSTLSSNMFYYAMRMEDGSVIRVAEEASSLFNVFLSVIPMILAVMLLMLLLCALAASKLTRHLIQPIEQMTAQLDDLSGVSRYPELEPFMDMIQKQHEEILQSADMRVEFTANVSHELKTPLTSISGYAELIESGMAKDEQITHFAGEIHRSANRLLTLINDIIRLSQLDGPMPDMAIEPVDLEEVAASTVRQLELNAHKMGVTLELDARRAVVDADRHMMDELLYNLCDNAIRYNVTGGSVRVEVRPLHEKVIVCVQDTGIGISSEQQKHVFERFYRVDKSRSKETGGTGLGLAIVKHIAAKHNATIDIDSELGRGTAITVTFPRRME